MRVHTIKTNRDDVNGVTETGGDGSEWGTRAINNFEGNVKLTFTGIASEMRSGRLLSETLNSGMGIVQISHDGDAWIILKEGDQLCFMNEENRTGRLRVRYQVQDGGVIQLITSNETI